MPSGRTHDRITLWLLPLIVIFSYLITRNGDLTLLCSGGFFFSGLMFGPDLDIYSLQFKRWGIFRVLWLPYQKLINHRSLLSHGFIIGTAIRVFYLTFWLFILAALVIAIAQLFFGFPWNWQSFIRQQWQLLIHTYPRGTISLLVGLEFGAMSHYFSDKISSLSRKKRNKPRIKVKN
jgi:uncharacterized metal-binding protein